MTLCRRRQLTAAEWLLYLRRASLNFAIHPSRRVFSRVFRRRRKLQKRHQHLSQTGKQFVLEDLVKRSSWRHATPPPDHTDGLSVASRSFSCLRQPAVSLQVLSSYKKSPSRWDEDFLVPTRGLEPPHLTVPDPKSGVSANFTTSALKLVLCANQFCVCQLGFPLLLQAKVWLPRLLRRSISSLHLSMHAFSPRRRFITNLWGSEKNVKKSTGSLLAFL